MDKNLDYTMKFEGISEEKLSIIKKYERDEFLKELLKSYLSK